MGLSGAGAFLLNVWLCRGFSALTAAYSAANASDLVLNHSRSMRAMSNVHGALLRCCCVRVSGQMDTPTYRSWPDLS